MNVVICSAFRNSVAYLDRYFDQVYALDALLFRNGVNLSLILGYGDSTDGTPALLFEHTSGGIGARLLDVSHGGPEFGPVVDAQRFKQLAYIGNRLLASVPMDANVAVWLESDLIWQPETLQALVGQVADCDCIAPMIMDSPPADTFYDTFGFRRDGQRFTKEPPFHTCVNGGLVAMESVGSCVAMRGAIARWVRVPEADVIVGLCAQVRAQGLGVWLDSRLQVFHP